MCLIVFAYHKHPHYPLILAANRDEFYDRPTAALDYWQDYPAVLAGRDLTAGGTWLGVNRNGRLAAITNYRQPNRFLTEAPSRGALVSDFLTQDISLTDYLQQLQARAALYNGYNLLLFDRQQDRLAYYSNQIAEPRLLAPGIYSLSNHLLDTAWPKVARSKQQLDALLNSTQSLTGEHLLKLLTDQWQPPERALPSTGISVERERHLAPIFIAGGDYGTRSSTAVLLDQQDRWQMLEQTHPDPIIDKTGLQTFSFRQAKTNL